MRHLSAGSMMSVDFSSCCRVGILGGTRPVSMRIVVPMIVLCGLATEVRAQRQMEHLGRGLVAIRSGAGTVFIGWRLLGTDPEKTAFNLYRSTGLGDPLRLNDEPLTGPTNFIDDGADLSRANSWFVRPIVEGREQEACAACTLAAN